MSVWRGWRGAREDTTRPGGGKAQPQADNSDNNEQMCAIKCVCSSISIRCFVKVYVCRERRGAHEETCVRGVCGKGVGERERGVCGCKVCVREVRVRCVRRGVGVRCVGVRYVRERYVRERYV